MTPDEIQALRETHHSDGHVLVERCFGCGDDWPCDVIQLLEAFDELKWELEFALNDLRKVESRLEAKSCHGYILNAFCPKCGVKL